MKNPYFYHYEARKWDWTISAVTKFSNGFKRFDLKTDEKEHVYIGVYGPTQVGKTTFILSLLGIDSNYINLVSDKLRGGREKGKSATVTCTVFERLMADHFEIYWPSGESFICQTLDEVEEVMNKLRISITEADAFSLQPVIVKIPNCYFNQQSVNSRARDLAIIDLPGDDSKDTSEIVHVESILKEYLHRCKVTIIMEISSQMTALTKIKKDIVRDWRELPQQFKIVLTRSISNDSIFQGIKDGRINNADDLKRTYFMELDRICENQQLENKIYPLEFGDSWAELKIKFPQFFSKAAEWIDEIYDEIIEDLTNIHSPEQEIKKLKSLERYIDKMHMEELAQLNNELKIIEASLSNLEIDCENYRKFGRQELKRMNLLEKYIQKWEVLPSINLYKPLLTDWDKLLPYERKVSLLEIRFNSLQKDLKQKALEATFPLQKIVREGQLLKIQQLRSITVPNELFNKKIQFDYVFDRYLFSSTYMEDKEKYESIFQLEIKEFYHYIEEVRNKNLQKSIQAQQLQKEKIASLLAKVENVENNMTAIKNQHQAKLLEIEVANNDWIHDKQRSQQLDLFLMESFIEQSNEYKLKLLNPGAPKTEKWYIHQYWNIMKEQAKGMITL